jgi:hypothetical protein
MTQSLSCPIYKHLRQAGKNDSEATDECWKVFNQQRGDKK